MKNRYLRPLLAAALLGGLAATASAGNYCVSAPNSTGSGALIGSQGPVSIATGDFTLTIENAPPRSFGMFFYGGGALQMPFGNGFRCVRPDGRGVHRFKGIKPIDGMGRTFLTVDFSRRPAGMGKGTILPDSTWYFQYIYRDPLGPMPNGFNLSDGLMVTFEP